MRLCPDCLGRGWVYSPGGYAPKRNCLTCRGAGAWTKRELASLQLDASPGLASGEADANALSAPDVPSKSPSQEGEKT